MISVRAQPPCILAPYFNQDRQDRRALSMLTLNVVHSCAELADILGP
jgi:hypothetical protein